MLGVLSKLKSNPFQLEIFGAYLWPSELAVSRVGLHCITLAVCDTCRRFQDATLLCVSRARDPGCQLEGIDALTLDGMRGCPHRAIA